VVNPASKNRRSHWVGAPYPQEADVWLEKATEHKGSWWPRWMKWLDSHGGGKRKAPTRLGSVKHKSIEAAPGRYVRHRVVH
jgi:polyhydroxyalkanoate synthase